MNSNNKLAYTNHEKKLIFVLVSCITAVALVSLPLSFGHIYASNMNINSRGSDYSRSLKNNVSSVRNKMRTNS